MATTLVLALMASFALTSWATAREDQRASRPVWIVAIHVTVAALAFCGLVFETVLGPAASLRYGWRFVAPCVGIGLAATFVRDFRRGLNSAAFAHLPPWKGFWLLLLGTAFVAAVQVGVVWVNFRFAFGRDAP